MSTPSIVTLLATIHLHMRAFELPEPCNMTIDPTPNRIRRHVGVHMDAGRDLTGLATQLLAWADTLTDVTVTTWRSLDGGSVHLDLNGVLADGSTTVQVWGSVPHDAARFALDRNEVLPIELACLREWAALGSEVAA